MLGEENTYGAMAGRAAAGPVTYARVSTDDVNGIICPTSARANWRTSRSTPSDTALSSTPLGCKTCWLTWQERLRASRRHDDEPCCPVLSEAFETYMGWDVYHHK
ncbi:MAG: hypothetical protein R6W69_15005 [Anaerolineales bacterium]